MKTSFSLKPTTKIIPPRCAVKVAREMFISLGYIKVSGSRFGTCYFAKMGTFRKIRISDHRCPVSNSDVLVDIIIDEPTIHPDIEYRVKKAHSEYQSMMNGKRVHR